MILASRNRQWSTYLLTALIAFLLTAISAFFSAEYYDRFLGTFHPVVISGIASCIGAISLWLLHRNHGFYILKRKSLHGIGLSIVFATISGLLIILVDSLNPFPEDMNVPYPESLLFYPAIAFIAEITFHIMPLALVLTISTSFFPKIGKTKLIWFSVFLVALIEPLFQLMGKQTLFSFNSLYTFAHVYVIAGLQLYLFWRHDFFTMFCFRLLYYLYWHILWGSLRLELLF